MTSGYSLGWKFDFISLGMALGSFKASSVCKMGQAWPGFVAVIDLCIILPDRLYVP